MLPDGGTPRFPMNNIPSEYPNGSTHVITDLDADISGTIGFSLRNYCLPVRYDGQFVTRTLNPSIICDSKPK